MLSPGRLQQKHQGEVMDVSQRRLSDRHPWVGQVTAHIEMPTLLTPPECRCTWVVFRAGAGLASMSYLKYRDAACLVRHGRAAREAAG